MKKINRQTGFLNPMERLSRKKQEILLNGKLKEIVAFAYKKVPAVKTKFDKAKVKPRDIQTIRDLERLPITEKADLVKLQKKALPFGGFTGVPLAQLKRIYASPGPIYEPGEKHYEDDRWAQGMYAAGMRKGDIGIITFSFHMVPFAFMLDESLRQLGCLGVPSGVGNTELQVGIMKDLKVNAYLGTPSFLHAIANKGEEMGLNLKKDLRLEVGYMAAEMLPEILRSDLEKRFGMIIRQSYGTADIGCLGYECREKNGMHFPADCIVEVVNPATGKTLGPGEVGEVVGTVFNKVYPLIRFGSGDLSYYDDAPCTCGRTSPRLVKIVGRVDQVTKVKGMFVHPGLVDQVAGKFAEIARYQVVITRQAHKDEMTFRAELKKKVRDEKALAASIETVMQEILRLKGKVVFVAPKIIPEGAKKIEDARKWD